MIRQGSLFAPGSANREEPIQARVLARRADPVTSKAAARRVVESGRLTKQQYWALEATALWGPGTTWQIGHGDAKAHYLLARRLPELERRGLVRVQRKDGRDVVRDGSRVWEIVP